MGHSEDDAVHKIPHEVKTHWQNLLKISVLVQFKILHRIRYKKIDGFLFKNLWPPQYIWDPEENASPNKPRILNLPCPTILPACAAANDFGRAMVG